jgi:hypothetical protein
MRTAQRHDEPLAILVIARFNMSSDNCFSSAFVD